MTRHCSGRVAPFGDPRVEGCSAPHRGLSHPSTSFIGFWCQGIHRVLLVSLQKNTLLCCHYADFKVHAGLCPAGWKNRVCKKRGLSKLNSVASEAHDQTLLKPGRRTSRFPHPPEYPLDADLRCWSPQIPRKEVIQPHLPVRLPCYDFTPITQPTFDDSLPCGLGHRLRVFQAFVV